MAEIVKQNGKLPIYEHLSRQETYFLTIEKKYEHEGTKKMTAKMGA